MDLGRIIKIIIWEENPDDDEYTEIEIKIEEPIPVEIPELVPEEENA